MTKTVQAGGRDITLRVSALLPRKYRYKFGRDMVKDINGLRRRLLELVEKYKAGDFSEDFTPEQVEAFEDLTWTFAKAGDPSTPESVEEWLDSFDAVLGVYTLLPEVLLLWTESEQGTSEPAKKAERQ